MKARSSRGTFICQGEPNSKPVRTRIPESSFNQLLKVIDSTGMSQSEFLRQAIIEKLSSFERSVSQS